jgi:hypothetical protein
MGAADRLSEHVAIMRSGDISKSTVHRFIGLLRELLGERDELKKYPLSRMFCDWSVHTKLDRSPAGTEFLDLIDAMFTGNADAQVKKMRQGLSPVQLRRQIITLLATSYIDPTIVSEPQLCSRIFNYLYDDLKGKSVARSTKDRQTKPIERLADSHRFIADRFFFQNGKNGHELVLVAKVDPPSSGEIHIVCPWQV